MISYHIDKEDPDYIVILNAILSSNYPDFAEERAIGSVIDKREKNRFKNFIEVLITDEFAQADYLISSAPAILDTKSGCHTSYTISDRERTFMRGSKIPFFYSLFDTDKETRVSTFVGLVDAKEMDDLGLIRLSKNKKISGGIKTPEYYIFKEDALRHLVDLRQLGLDKYFS